MVESDCSSCERLKDQLARLAAENIELRKENQQLKEQVQIFNERLRALERCSLRQAAPFRIPESKRKQEPNKPGRKSGHKGFFRFTPKHVDETITVPLNACPKCGSLVRKRKKIEQFIEEIPPLKPHVTRLVTYRAKCANCGIVRSAHPKQVSLAQGAAKTHLGARALAFSAELNKRLGLTVRKTTEILRRSFGLSITPGGITQTLSRVGRRLEPLYERLRERIRASPAVYGDETSWWVGGPGFWLWVFTTPRLTLYIVENTRGSTVVNHVLGEKFGGVLVSDCLSTYDPIGCAKHKCYAHHLRAVKQLMPDKAPHSLLPKIQLLLKTAIIWKEQKARLGSKRYLKGVRSLEQAMDETLASVDPESEDQRIATRLLKQRPHLFTFLHHDEVDATNNRAERALRPAVIARKLSCGNKTLQGKRTWEILTSLGATLEQNGKSYLDAITKWMPLRARPRLSF